MASQPTSRTLQPPPALPAMPDVSSTLTNYLTNFSLWCRHGFADKLSVSTAQPGLLLQAHDAAPGSVPKVFLVQVNTAGAITATAVPLGSGKP